MLQSVDIVVAVLLTREEAAALPANMNPLALLHCGLAVEYSCTSLAHPVACCAVAGL
jgi:hypothetical protein